MTTTQAVIYARSRNDPQGQSLTLLDQIEACRKYAAERGYRVVGEFNDVRPAESLDRPGLNTLREVAKQEGASVVLVSSLDRVGSDADQRAFADALSKAGMKVEVVSGGQRA